ncbi:MAG: glycoside hydrolase family 3 C-terminal domain-containing protein [Clostridia bacterium]|nr:glycoside hydrolase family 3 C-terminal domain-containing protein [Clostridia bacterium]
MQYEAILSKLSLEQKAALCSGKDFWYTKGVEEAGLPEVMMTDGPHGVRKQPNGDINGIGGSIPATCFLPACTSAASWDKGMLYRMGQALGEEALSEKVSVLLGPGVNIKRNPLCGRNFEYFSEDPYLSGKLAASLIGGIQSTGTGACIKHFAANNQETRRQTISSVVDERTLREIYFTAFEIAIKEANPWAVMNAYNKLNGTYCSENSYLLSKVLRRDWGYNGLVMTDWGAENDRIAGLKAGGNLEMPYSNGFNDAKIVEAVQNGTLDEKVLDANVDRVIDFILKAKEHNLHKIHVYDKQKHHALARSMAANSFVLLKNEGGILPLQKGQKVAVIGEMAQKPRFQGAGSSFIEPTKLDSAMGIYKTEYGYEPKYAQGYSCDTDVTDETLLAEAVEVAAKDPERRILLFVGLTDIYEAEAFDRDHMRLPDNQSELIERVCAVNENVIVILHCGSPVEMPFAPKVKGILCTYLGGQAGAGAVLDLLYGKQNPSGKLPETFPLRYEDVPSAKYFPEGPLTVEYRESIYVGYRYFDTAEKEVLFPFGFGLSYTEFAFSDLKLSSENIRDDDSLTVSFKVKNIGQKDGAEVCQLYVGMDGGRLFRAKKELKEFTKIYLKAGAEKEVHFELDKRAFAYYNVNSESFEVETGRYTVYVGNASNHLPLQKQLRVTNTTGNATPDYSQSAAHYYGADLEELKTEEFEAIYGAALPSKEYPADYKPDLNYTFDDMHDTLGGRVLCKIVAKTAGGIVGGTKANKKMTISMLMASPLRASALMSSGMMSMEMAQDVLTMGTGHFWRGLGKLLVHTVTKNKNKKK